MMFGSSGGGKRSFMKLIDEDLLWGEDEAR